MGNQQDLVLQVLYFVDGINECVVVIIVVVVIVVVVTVVIVVLLDVMPVYDCAVVGTEGALDVAVSVKKALRKEPNVVASPGAHGTISLKGEGLLKVSVSQSELEMHPSCSENFTMTTSYSSIDLL